MAKASTRPSPSALSTLISQHISNNSSTPNFNLNLPLEILHNLQHQHSWRELHIHSLSPSTSPTLTEVSATDIPHLPTSSDTIYLLSGLPPRHAYLHPDFQSHLLRQKIADKDVRIQREYVLPISLGETYTLKKLSWLFDALPQRSAMEVDDNAMEEGKLDMEWRDAKRVLMGMMAASGMGGDGTVVYYVVQEGEVKPRQNG